MIRLLLTMALLCAMQVLYAQTTEAVYTSRPAMESEEKYLVHITAVYGSERMEADPELVKQLLILLKERVHYSYQPEMPEEKCPLISSVGLHNKHNPQIEGVNPATFSPDTFNPLVYNWDYFSANYQTFRIDGTGYVIVIDPQTIKNQ